MKVPAYLRKNRWPLLAVLGGTAAALSGFVPQSQLAVAPEPRSEAKPARAASAPSSENWDPTLIPPMPAEQDEPAAGQTLSGVVQEQIDVDKYSYLRLGEQGSPGTWAAVPVSASRVGQRVTVSGAELMTHFVSATLKRTFETIYFGMLDSGADTSRPGTGELAAARGGELELPHPGAGRSADGVVVGHVKRALGALGSTVAELSVARSEAAGKKARVHAIVVKSTGGVLGRTFLHVRDGSGDARAGTNDLTVTTDTEFAVGSDVLLEGTVELDQDFGSGYRYHVLLADAQRVAE
jgi:hypothetical protein